MNDNAIKGRDATINALKEEIAGLNKHRKQQAEQIRQLMNLVALAEGRDTKQAEQIERLKEQYKQAIKDGRVL